MTNPPTLIVMAAGIGSRYGGLKQVDPIGPNGEIVIDYAVFDALRAGFGKVIFLIRRDIEEIFREKIGRSVEGRVETVYVFQELNNLPPGFSVPPDRKKPWGTGHAVLSCKEVVHEPFAVINADDFYGPGAMQALGSYLRQAQDPTGGPYDYSMAGYVLENTLSEHGTVSRGVCEVTPERYLAQVHERTKIKRFGNEVKYTEDGENWVTIPANSTVSMNMWGFTPSFFKELELLFPLFLTENAENLSRVEFFLPNVVNQLLSAGKASVKVLPVQEKWFGVTHPEDRPFVQAAIRELVRQGVYPENLWS
jgi:dTDP-glucose pyrophosphorylase